VPVVGEETSGDGIDIDILLQCSVAFDGTAC
jgi:hypothetical protein